MQFLEGVMSSELDRELVNKTTNILSILSKKDALTIFLLAQNGLKAETNTPQKVGLTRKQYYTRLKQLVDSGLIDKTGDEYIHTTLGSFVHQKHVLELFEHAKNVKQMKMVDTLKRTNQFSEDDISKFIGKIGGKSLETSALLRTRFIGSYEDLVSTVVDGIQLCKNEIFLASRFANDVIINNMIRKADAGLHVKVIADPDLVKGFLLAAKEKLGVTDENAIERLSVTSNPWYPKPENIGRKFMRIPYCLMILDGKEAGIEIIDRNEPDKFKGAIFVKDETFVAEIKKMFNSWWESAKEDDLTKILQNVVREL